MDGFIKVRGGEFRHLVLFDYELFDKICDKMKKVLLQIVLIITFEKWEWIHVILYLFKKCWLFL